MKTEEEQYLENAKAEGVDIEIETTTEETQDETTTEPEKKEETVEEKKELVTEPKEERKRSIYDEYKEKKAELKSEKERAEIAERERDELRQKYEALANADTQKEQKEASDEIEAFAQKINADPEALREMRKLFLKDIAPTTDPAIAQKLEQFEKWQAENSKIVEKAQFEDEFKSVVPTIKELLPNANDAEMQAVKEKLDEISHTKEFHDKDLDYIVYKNRTELSKLVSPKKRGMEHKGKADIVEDSFEFDPNADYSKMSLKEREVWEENYKKFTSSEGLSTDANGKKILI